MKKKDSENQVQYLPLYMSLGMCIGVAIGAALDNIAVCMCLGMAIGMCLGSVLDNANRAKNEDAEDRKKEETE